MSVDNAITLPARYARPEFAPRHCGSVIMHTWSVGQVLYAFGPHAPELLLVCIGLPAALGLGRAR